MSVDPYAEQLRGIVHSWDHAADIARRQRRHELRKFARRKSREAQALLQEIERPAPAAAEGEPDELRPATPATAPDATPAADLPPDWAGRLRKRILRSPFGSIGLTQAVKCYHRVPAETLRDAADRHSWFAIVRAKRGLAIRLADEAKQDPPPPGYTLSTDDDNQP